MSKTAMLKPDSRPGRALASAGKFSSVNGLSWNLPSGESLVEHALRVGFLASPLLALPVGKPGAEGPARPREDR
jgi:hypothetical protein